MYKIYIANPEPLQFKSLGYHWSYAFWIVPALLAAAYVRGRGAWLANIAAFLGLRRHDHPARPAVVDWYDSAIGQVYGVDGRHGRHEPDERHHVGPARLHRCRA